MFSLFEGIYDSYLAPTQMNLLIVGGTNSGKSALLERLKVTEIPTRPRNKKTALDAEQMTQTLYTAFVETGAVDIAGRRKSSVRKITDTETKSTATPEEINRRLAAAEAACGGKPSQPVAAATKKKSRFSFNICPAPERYLKSSQDQDEDFEDAEHEAEQEKLLAGRNKSETRSYEQEIMNELGEEEGNSSFNGPPRRVRCHSKEFNVDSLDLMDGRRSSMQDIPLSGSITKSASTAASNVTQTSSQRSSMQPRPTVQGSELLQSSSEEYNLKPKAKILPLIKIRPTSKFRFECGDSIRPTCWPSMILLTAPFLFLFVQSGQILENWTCTAQKFTFLTWVVDFKIFGKDIMTTAMP